MKDNMNNWPCAQDIRQAQVRIQPFAHRTPILQCQYLNELTGCRLFLKCQNLQKTGSFKVRGAANKITQLQGLTNICTHSSGNHGQAVAYVGRQLQLRTKIVMPGNTPDVKKNAVRGYGAQIIESGPTAAEQEAMSKRVSQQSQAQLIHPYNDYQIIAGAATIAKQVFEDAADLDYIVFPVGGGGLASGTALTKQYFSPKTKAIGVQPYLARDAYLSLKTSQLVPQLPPVTLAQGVRTGLGDKTFEIIKQYLDDIILVQELEMVQASMMLAERMKMVVQISGSLGVAAVLKDARFKGKRVVVILSGGNIDMSSYFQSLRQIHARL